MSTQPQKDQSSATSVESVLRELGLVEANIAKQGNEHRKLKAAKPEVTSLKVLQRLLETNVVTCDQLRDAHTYLLHNESKKTENCKETIHKNEKMVASNGRSACSTDQSHEKMKTTPYRTRHIALRIYYEGKNYSGLAQNVGLETDQSVERHLFAALQKTHLVQGRDSCQYSRCGRTDKGVSAVGQVVAMQLKSAIPDDATWTQDGDQRIDSNDIRLPKHGTEKVKIWVLPKAKLKAKSKKHKQAKDDETTTVKLNSTQPPKRQSKELAEFPYDKMLNSVLPPDIRVLGWCPVSTDFSARFSASDRTYRYFFVSRPSLDVDRMKQGLKLLVGTHDFRNFCKLNVVEVSNFVRTIHAAEIFSTGDNTTVECCHYFQIRGQAFLWHQIRCIVSVMFLIGRGLEQPELVTELLNVEEYPGKPSYPLATEYPLVLHDCGYPRLQMGYSVSNLWTLTCQLEEQWETVLLEAARIRNCLNMLQHNVKIVRRCELADFAVRRLTERDKKQQRQQRTQKKSKNAATNSENGINSGKDWMAMIRQIQTEQQQQSKLSDVNASVSFLTWHDALQWLSQWNIIPDFNGLRDHVHIPLLERSRGTTYEEKIEALQQNASKRTERWQENVKKRKAGEDDKSGDAAFYEHMLNQGGSAV